MERGKRKSRGKIEDVEEERGEKIGREKCDSRGNIGWDPDCARDGIFLCVSKRNSGCYRSLRFVFWDPFPSGGSLVERKKAEADKIL